MASLTSLSIRSPGASRQHEAGPPGPAARSDYYVFLRGSLTQMLVLHPLPSQHLTPDQKNPIISRIQRLYCPQVGTLYYKFCTMKPISDEFRGSFVERPEAWVPVWMRPSHNLAALPRVSLTLHSSVHGVSTLKHIWD